MDKKPADPEKLKRLEDVLEFFNTFLDGHTFAVGNELTIADYALFTTVLTISITPNVDINKFENVGKWFVACKEAIGQPDIVDQHVDGLQSLLSALQNK